MKPLWGHRPPNKPAWADRSLTISTISMACALLRQKTRGTSPSATTTVGATPTHRAVAHPSLRVSSFLANWRHEVDVYYVSATNFTTKLSAGQNSDFRCVEVRIYVNDSNGARRNLATLKRVVAYVPSCEMEGRMQKAECRMNELPWQPLSVVPADLHADASADRRPTSAFCLLPSAIHRRGLTLIELMISIMILSFTVAALGMMSRAVEISSEYNQGYGTATQTRG